MFFGLTFWLLVLRFFFWVKFGFDWYECLMLILVVLVISLFSATWVVVVLFCICLFRLGLGDLNTWF